MLKIDSRFIYGVEEMDSEHSELIQRAERLMQAYQKGDPQKEIIKLLSFLKDYVHEHFEHEEALQLQYQYPEIGEHIHLHEAFKDVIESLYADLLTEGLGLQARLKLNHITSEWIYTHIGEEDKKVATYILQRRAEEH